MDNRPSITQRLKAHFEDRISLLLILLISADLIFVLLYVLNRTYRFAHLPLYRLDIDGSYPEFYQYTKFVWIIILLIHIAIITRHKGYISWILVFLYFLADDALQIHERAGRFMTEHFVFELPFQLRVQDIGELAAFAMFGIPLLALLVWSYYRGAPTFKRIWKDMLLLVIIFAFFVIVFDLVHAAIDVSPTMDRIWSLTEDGAEMVVVSIITWYVFRVAFYRGRPTTFLLERPTADSESIATKP